MQISGENGASSGYGWNPSIVALGSGTVFGTVGEGIFGLATIVAVLHLKGSALSIGSMMVLMTLPSILLAPFQGVFLDRFNIRSLAIASNLLRVAIVLAFAFVVWGRASNLTELYVAITAYYVVWYFMVPLSETMVARVASKDGLHSGMVVLQGAWQAGALGSAFLAGVLLTVLPLHGVLIIVAVLDAVSGASFLFVTLPATGRTETAGTSMPRNVRQAIGGHLRSFRTDLTEGWRYIAADNTILWLVLITATLHPFYQAINTLLGPFNQNVLRGNSMSLGLVEGMAGVGSFLSALLCMRATAFSRSFVYLIGSQLLLIGSVAAFLSISSIGVAAGLYFLIGLFSGNAKILSKSMLIQVTESSYSGRVLSTSSLLALIAGVASALLSGLFALSSIPLAYLVAISLIVVGVVLAWRLKTTVAGSVESSSQS
ncbi:MFS transporter [Burkholderia sp. Ed8]|uniref:MFS transporter n=1 Tax=Burkholderia sp. Ed8 TaxID=3112957 RepID=UPI00345CA207